MCSTRDFRPIWKRRFTRRQVLSTGAKAGVGASALAAVGAGTPRPAPARDDGTVGRGGRVVFPLAGVYSGNPPTLDPYENLSYRTQIPSGYHYSRLIRPVSAGPGVSPTDQAEYEADLASLPETPDSTTHLFRLNPLARWHDVDPLDGRRLSAVDIQQSHDRFQWTSPNAANWNLHVSAFEAVGSTIRIDTHRPYAPLSTLAGSASHLWITPPEIVDDGTVAERPVGSGAWIFETYEPDVALRWRRNPLWHGAGNNGEPFLDIVVATMNGDSNVLIPALGDGDLDFSQLTPALYDQARNAVPDARFAFTPNTVPGGFYFNFSIPPWNDVRVRQALSLAMDRDAVLASVDPTGHGGWQTALAQFEPYWLDPKDLAHFGRSYNGMPSGTLFHRDLVKSRQLLDAAGYPDGIQATVHATADYGATVVRFYEACALSVADAGFRFEFFFKEYAAYIYSIFRGNFPDNWDGESSHLAIGPFFGGARDPDEILAAVYDRESTRHNWGASGRWSSGAQSHLDTGGHADGWSHVNAASDGGPETDETLHTMIQRQREILDVDERREYLNDIQRYLATQMYIVPYVATPGVYAFNDWVRYRNADRVHLKATFGIGQEFLPGLWIDRDRPRADTSSGTMTNAPGQTIEVRIVARQLADGRIEFALRPTGIPSVLPRGRFFPANARSDVWLQSTPVVLQGIELGRIRARRLSDGRTEFGFVDAAGLPITPRVRFFPSEPSTNSWLQSSAFQVAY